MKKLLSSLHPFPNIKIGSVDRLLHLFKIFLFSFLALFTTISFAQTFPSPSSCTSKDLLLVAATLPSTPCETCTPGSTITKPLSLGINNKTGSTRTAFAFWGTLVKINANGTIASTTPISGCFSPIPKNAITNFLYGNITYNCGQTLQITNLFLAWTDASPNSTCANLTASPSTINPKCGTLPVINIVAGLDAILTVTDATCTTPGSVKLEPMGGTPPYKIAIGNNAPVNVAAGGSTTFTGLNAGDYTFTITDANNCAVPVTKTRTIGAASAVTANAGADFTKTCLANTSGGTIGEAAAAGFTYSWVSSPVGFTSSAANPNVNPSVTTTYTVTKTNTASGCSDDDDVTVTVNNAAVTANAGNDFRKTCLVNTSGGTIGEAAALGFTYSWVSSPVGFTSSAANPSVNPTVTTTYTVTKTNSSSGCSDDDDVTVTVDNAAVTANAGNDFTKSCLANANGGTIGEAAALGFTYSWVSSPVGFTSFAANPNVNPTVTTTYTVTKTNTSSGCSDDDDVTVTVNNAAVTANAGNDFTKSCTLNGSGGTIGEAAALGFTYSWASSPAGFTSSAANPNVNPSVSTTYTVTKTNTSSGCSDDDDVIVTVDNTPPAAPSICVTQPSLCGPATGSISINSPTGVGFEYSIDNGTTWQIGTLFDNLAAGSVTGIKVKNPNGCISLAADCSASNCSSRTGSLSQPITQFVKPMVDLVNITDDQPTVKAYPNPFSDKVRFQVKSGQSGSGNLEVFNILGQKVKTVYQGFVPAGVNNYELSIPNQVNGQLFYRFSIGKKQVTGKLMQMKQ